MKILVFLCAIVYLSLVRAASYAKTSWCTEQRPGAFGTNVTQLINCPSVNALLLVPYLWTPIQITVKCPNSWYTIYTGVDENTLSSAIDAKASPWCGWESVLDGTLCKMQVSPFQRTLIGIKSNKACNVSSEAAPSYFMALSGLAGLLLFYLASLLSSSVLFRLSCGSIMFTTGSLLILLVILFRQVPHKRKLGAVVAVGGSSGWAFLRWLTGQWWPSWNQLITNRFFAIYVVVSAAIGAGATYLYDDPHNPKVNTLIKVALRIGGLGLVYAATWTYWPLSSAIMGVLAATVLGPTVSRNAQGASQKVQMAAEATARVITTPFARRPRTPGTTTPAPPQTLFFGHRPSINNRGTRTVPHGAEEEVVEDIAVRTPKDLRGSSALHLRTPPPDPWSVRRLKTFEDKMHQTIMRGAPGAGAAAGKTRGAATSGRRGTASVTHDNEEWEEGAGQHSEGEEAEEEKVHHLVQSGYIINPTSNRPIRIGGDTYLRLVESGFTPNRSSGRMEEPAGGITPGEGGRSTSTRRRSLRSGR